MILRCADCGAEVRGAVKGWLAVYAQVPDEDEQPLIVVYCPECAERECWRQPRLDRPTEFDG